MASELKELVFKMNRLDCYKRYAMHKMLRDSGVYFGQPPVLDYLSTANARKKNFPTA